MNDYNLTVFMPNGEKALDESFQARDDAAAKDFGLALLSEKGLTEHSHRCTSSKGKLLLFHS